MIQILDCTLRDGGYINDFCFGQETMTAIIEKLSRASIDIIECGFLRSGCDDSEKSLFGSVASIKRVIAHKKAKVMYVAMIQYGAIDIDEIEEYTGDSIDGIRVTFHEHEIDGAFQLGEQLKKKNYKVFMQPVGTTSYTDSTLLSIIEKVNHLNPYAFYIVDTLGIVYKKDLLRMFYLVDHNLNQSINIGYHSHNNLQLSFSNAQELLQLNTTRNIIIDSSVFGMGRGAGNLNTELISQYINDNIDPRYNTTEILEVLDFYIKPLQQRYQWGYDAPYYISAIARCHPNYATYLLNKQTLRIRDIHSILHKLEPRKRALFDKEYIQAQYLSFMNNHIDDTPALDQLREKFLNKKIILVAPGKTILNPTIKEKIRELVDSGEYCSLSVNFCPVDFAVNAVFVSNLKRFGSIETICCHTETPMAVIVTSNIIPGNATGLIAVDYMSYTVQDCEVMDNAGLMCMNLLRAIGIEEIVLVGFDGFKSNVSETFFDSYMFAGMDNEQCFLINKAMTKNIRQLRTQMKISFMTNSIYDT